MRICMVAYTFYENDARVMRYAEALVARGDEVDVIALRRPGQTPFCRYRGVDLYRIQTRVSKESSGKLAYLSRLTRFLIKSSWTIGKLYVRHPYGVVHVHSVPDFEVFAAWFPKMLGSKIILDIHDIVPEFYASKFNVSKQSLIFRLLVLMERLSIRFSNHVIIANHLWYHRLLQRSVTAKKCTTMLNYPDPGIFYPRPRKRTDSRFVFLYPGGIIHHQGVDVLVMAFNRIKEELPDAHVWIYGDGPDRGRIEELVEKLHLGGSVLFSDFVPQEKVAEIMAEADVAIVPKRSNSFGNEAFSTKSLELMSVGVPLIMSATRIDRHYFSDELVKFCRPGDDEDLAHCMRLLHHEPDLRKRLVKAAGAFVADLSWDKRKAEYLDLVDALCRTKTGRHIRAEEPENRGRKTGVSLLLKAYYRLRPFVPRRVQIWIRRRLVEFKQGGYEDVWPIREEASRRPVCFRGWPGGKRFALILRHDVETSDGLRKCPALIDVDKRYGLKAGYFFVPEDYHVSEDVRSLVLSSGCEVGVHGLKHDGRLYESRAVFSENARRINNYLEAWESVGFASPSAHHELDWLHDLKILYDSSTFDTDPFEPQPNSLNTVFPVIVSKDGHSYIELPYTMPQDFLLYVIMRKRTTQIWKDKLDWLVSHNGMVMLTTHPDYMRLEGTESSYKTYPLSLYQDLLQYVTSKYAGQYWLALPKEVAIFWRSMADQSP